MIIRTHSDREYDDTMALLRVINLFRGRGPEYYPPIIADTPWVHTRWANPRYL